MERRNRACVVAIDGPAGAGKSTVARAVAARLGYVYIDTGAMYRAVTHLALESRVAPCDAMGLLRLLETAEIKLTPQAGLAPNRVYVNGQDVTEAIRRPEVSRHVSEVARHPAVRARLVELQQALAKAGGVVMDGRDIGTVVLPDADVKVFLVADAYVRARRRWQELREQGHDVTLEEVQRELLQRDRQDETRSVSPLRKAPDAVEIDTSALSVDEVVERIVALCRRAGG